MFLNVFISFTIDTISVARQLLAVQQRFVLCPNCVLEKVDVNPKGVNQKQYSCKEKNT